MHRLQDARRTARTPARLTGGAARSLSAVTHSDAVRPPASRYLGRFAPSPSGPLHLGSLYTALASYLQAKSLDGEWLVRIDDVDPERSRAAAADAIRRTLEAFGLLWDREIVHQSWNGERYADALSRLQSASLLYPCTCSRKMLAADPGVTVYPGYCRSRRASEPAEPCALRLRTSGTPVIAFTDWLQGPCAQDLETEVGDFIIRRRDGAVAYHLATVLDDHDAGVTEVVRGIDLLPSTPRQIHLQQLLGLSRPRYCHLPILVDGGGRKLSKRTQATAADPSRARDTLFRLLVWLQQPPRGLADESITAILSWGVANWNPDHLRRRQQIDIGRAEAELSDSSA